jgi:hypothetical protein
MNFAPMRNYKVDVAGLYKLNESSGLKAPGFKPRAYEVMKT